MLKTRIRDQIRLIQQHHHAEISGFLAAHWGGVNGFARPGHFPGAPAPERLREEAILGIAEHDNGWWEDEALPRFSSQDGLPVGLGDSRQELGRQELEEWRDGGFSRWRRGVDRLAARHPYAALMVSHHASWLYATELPEGIRERYPAMPHFVFSGERDASPLVGDPKKAVEFLEEQSRLQAKLKACVAAHPFLAGAESVEILYPHVRLLQLLDTFSLYMALNDRETHLFENVPRGGWNQRTDIRWEWQNGNTIRLSPFPFDLDPLPVSFPVRLAPAGKNATERRLETPIASIVGAPYQTVEFLLRG